MIERFFPDLMVDSISDIDLLKLKERNIKGLILDIDNTLVPSRTKEAGNQTIDWFESVKDKGMKACIVSNASRTRVVKFTENLKVFAIHRASKPSSKALIKAAKHMGTLPEETAVVGDQIFTDIYGGNKLNMYTILVKPIDKREFFFVRLKRIPEKLVFRNYHKKTEADESLRSIWKRKSASRRISGG